MYSISKVFSTIHKKTSLIQFSEALMSYVIYTALAETVLKIPKPLNLRMSFSFKEICL